MNIEMPTESEPVKVIEGDALEVLRWLPDGVFDAVVTDPPYGKSYHSGGVSALPSQRWTNPKLCQWDGVTILGDKTPDTRATTDSFRVTRNGGACYVFSQWMVEEVWVKALRDAGFTVRNRLVWVKPFHTAGDLQTTYGPRHESVLFAAKGRHLLREGRDGDVWVEPIGDNGCFRKGKLHPTEKPVKLLRHLIRKSTEPGDLILDPFVGSGTTLVAAALEGRRAIGIEREPHYCAIVRRRIDEVMGKSGLFATVPA